MPKATRARAMLAAIMALLSIAPAAAQEPPPFKPYGEIGINWMIAPLPADDAMRMAAPLGNFWTWLKSEDYPPESVAAMEHSRAELTLDIAADGRVTGCARNILSGPDRVTAKACDLITSRGKFRHALDLTGQPMAQSLTMRLSYWVQAVKVYPAVAPPAPWQETGWRGERTGGSNWARDRLFNGIQPRIPVKWPDFRPKDKLIPRQADVGVLVTVDTQGQPQNCLVQDSSGHPTLDLATCTALRSAAWEWVTPPRQDMDLAYLVRWNGKKAQIATPFSRYHQGYKQLRASLGTAPLAIPAAELPPKIEGRPWINPEADIWLDAAGQPQRCVIVKSANDDDLDRRTCAIAMTRLLYLPARDEFGRPINGGIRIRVDWNIGRASNFQPV